MTSEAKKYQPVETSHWAHRRRHCRVAAAAAAFQPASAAAAPRAWVCQLCVFVREIVCGGTHYVSTRLCPFPGGTMYFSPFNLYFELPVMERRFDLIPGTILTPVGTDEQRYLWQRRIDIYSANRDLTVSGIVYRGELSRAPRE